MNTRDEAHKKGLVYAIAAFVWWGVSPLYFKLIAAVAPLEVIAHRVLWSALTLALLLGIWQRQRLLASFSTLRQHAMVLTLAAVLLSVNWLTYVYAINSGQVLEASLGYFINPLVNVALGGLFLGERMNRMQKFAVFLGLIGVVQEMVRFAQVPLIALTLAGTFGVYGLLRKRVEVGGSEGLFIETLILFIPALGYLLFLGQRQQLAFWHQGTVMDLLLAASGVVTTVPLIWFIAASKRLSYTSVGMLQYIGPTLMGVLGYFVWHEAFPPGRLLTFVLVWTGLAGIILGQWLRRREWVRAR